MNDRKTHNTLEIYSDGASRGNPGMGAYAFLIVRKNQPLKAQVSLLPHTTNNQAEYIALIKALENSKEYKESKIIINSDSELMIKQIKGEYKVRNKELIKLHNKIINLLKDFTQIEINHKPRENKYIKFCDRLCNQLLNSVKLTFKKLK